MRKLSLTGIVLCCCAAFTLGADIVGNWDLLAESSYGEQYNLLLTVQRVDDQLQGTLGSPEGEIPLENPKLEGNKFTFEIYANGTTYAITTTVEEDSLEGTYSGGGDTGTVKAKRAKQ